MSIARHGDVEIYYQSIGHETDPTLILINGLGSQCINFDLEFCQRFVERGLRVVRFDNRDVGLSSAFNRYRPDVFGTISALGEGREPIVPYRLADMAGDTLAVLDALGVERAHVSGWSLGGMIAQQLAIDHPERLWSFASVMATTGDPDVGQPSPEALAIVLGPSEIDRKSIIAKRQELERIIGSPVYFDPQRVAEETGAAYDRNFNLAGAARQLSAILASGSRSARLAGVHVPALVVHGDADRFIDVSGGVRTAQCVPGARLEIIEGMGHDLSPHFWDRLVALIADHADAARAL